MPNHFNEDLDNVHYEIKKSNNINGRMILEWMHYLMKN